jgi:hypothetical protein
MSSVGVDAEYVAGQLSPLVVNCNASASLLAAQDRIRRALDGLGRIQEACAAVAEAEIDAEVVAPLEYDAREDRLLARLRRHTEQVALHRSIEERYCTHCSAFPCECRFDIEV